MNYEILSQIKCPKDLQNIQNADELCKEIRKKLVEVTSKNGGHLSPNLGVVELTVALHRVFNNPNDKIFWDVGHQCYTHKMLTSRFQNFDTIRKEGGISGFCNRFESEYDPMTTGHSSTAISSALGFVESRQIAGEEGNVIAIIGDGALTGGLAYEGLNNAGKLRTNFIIILNDNKMSISKNVGAVARLLTAARLRPTYMKMRTTVENILEKIPILGTPIKGLLSKSKTAIKNVVYRNNIFEYMGFRYYGLIDGHNITELESVLKIAKEIPRPVVIHITTSKGKGYSFAEKNPKDFHGISKFNSLTGMSGTKSTTFSDVFGQTICKLAEENSKICAITAAMTSGTGLEEFKNKFRKRFFDVGIAEEHAITFAGGLACGSMLPIFAVYSSFLQRAYDQIIHDAALQKFKMILAIDRAGFVGEDGETHQGLFDVPFLSTIPNVEIFSPSFFNELELMLTWASKNKTQNITAIRYPRGQEFFKPENYKYSNENFKYFTSEKENDTLAITYGRIFSNVILAQKNQNFEILKLNKIFPIDMDAVKQSLKFKKIVFFEEGMKSGGIAEKFGNKLLELGFKNKYKIVAVNDEFVPHMSIERQLEKTGLNANSIELHISKFDAN